MIRMKDLGAIFTSFQLPLEVVLYCARARIEISVTRGRRNVKFFYAYSPNVALINTSCVSHINTRLLKD